MDKTKVTKDLENKTLTIERSFDAPKDKVWQAYADKEAFEKWWGPEGWETTVKEFNFTPGGRVHYCMKCVDQNQGEFFGQESWGLSKIKTTDEPNSFTYEDFFSNPEGTVQGDMPGLAIDVKLVDDDGKTRLVIRIDADSAEDIEKLLKMGMVEGFSSQMNKLDQLLAQ